MTLPGIEGPAQGWAERSGAVQVRMHAPADWSPEAVGDRLQISEVFYRFALAHDETRTDVIGSCFTVDGVLEVAEASADPFQVFSGRASVIDGLTKVIRQQADQRRHLMSNVLVDGLDRQTASVVAYGHVSRCSPGPVVELGASVIYVARMLREPDGCWRFARLFIGMDGYAGPRPESTPVSAE